MPATSDIKHICSLFLIFQYYIIKKVVGVTEFIYCRDYPSPAMYYYQLIPSSEGSDSGGIATLQPQWSYDRYVRTYVTVYVHTYVTVYVCMGVCMLYVCVCTCACVCV